MLPPQVPEASLRPFRLNATVGARGPLYGNVCRSSRFRQSQTFRAPPPPAASRAPSGLNATEYAVPTVWAVSHGPEKTSRPSLKSQTLNRRSAPADTTYLP